MPPKAVPGPKLKILVVEDDAATLELMQEVLSSFGVEVRSLQDSREAAELVRTEKFDGIFIDLLMPTLDGFRLARQIRDSGWNKSTPIIVVTGSDDRKTIEEAFAAGGSFFLRKPVDRQRLSVLLNTTRGAMLESRRRFMRVPVRMRVDCQRADKTVTCMSRNLSEKGIAFDVDENFAKGQQVRLSFMLPGQDAKMTLAGVVTRVAERLVAVSFVNLNPTDRQRIRLFIGADS